MSFLRLIPLLCLAWGEHCSESCDKASLLQTKALTGEEALLSNSLRWRRRRHKDKLPFVDLWINVAVDDSNRDDVLTKLREQETEFFLNFLGGITFFGIPYKAKLQIWKATSTQVQFHVGFIPDLRLKFGVVDPAATLSSTVCELDRLLRGPTDNLVRIRYDGAVVGGFFFEGRLLVQASNVSWGKPVLSYVKQDSKAYGYGYHGYSGHGEASAAFLPANVSDINGNPFVWELRKTWLTNFQGETGKVFFAIQNNQTGWINLIANSSDPDTLGRSFVEGATEEMAFVSELLFRGFTPRDNVTVVNALVAEFQQDQRWFYKEEQWGYEQRILDWLSQQPATAGFNYTVTTDISLVWTIASPP
ncbi:unnamed protein product [Symbiodinium natans]|uniref:Uncharacterized protein n=1 Tax=Symbiodinium natans TaxID=878477 RepID=A0A812UZU1_9DINO|nr:unnamed protein product [Symbiodinium natans]